MRSLPDDGLIDVENIDADDGLIDADDGLIDADDGLKNVVGAFDELGAPLGRSRKYPLLLAYSNAAFAFKIPLPYL